MNRRSDCNPSPKEICIDSSPFPSYQTTWHLLSQVNIAVSICPKTSRHVFHAIIGEGTPPWRTTAACIYTSYLALYCHWWTAGIKHFTQGAKPTEELHMLQNSTPVVSSKLLWLHCFYISLISLLWGKTQQQSVLKNRSKDLLHQLCFLFFTKGESKDKNGERNKKNNYHR